MNVRSVTRWLDRARRAAAARLADALRIGRKRVGWATTATAAAYLAVVLAFRPGGDASVATFGVTGTLVALVLPAAQLAEQNARRLSEYVVERVTVAGGDRDRIRSAHALLENYVDRAEDASRGTKLLYLGFVASALALLDPHLGAGEQTIRLHYYPLALALGAVTVGVFLLLPFALSLYGLEATRYISRWLDRRPTPTQPAAAGEAGKDSQAEVLLTALAYLKTAMRDAVEQAVTQAEATLRSAEGGGGERAARAEEPGTMTENDPASKPVQTSIAPWLSVRDGPGALDYYKAAFGAVERYRLEDDTLRVVVAQLAIGPADFWLQEDPDSSPESSPGPGGGSIRMILTVDDPESVFSQAVAAGGDRDRTRLRRPRLAHRTPCRSVWSPLGGGQAADRRSRLSRHAARSRRRLGVGLRDLPGSRPDVCGPRAADNRGSTRPRNAHQEPS
jgi:PhnB protein